MWMKPIVSYAVGTAAFLLQQQHDPRQFSSRSVDQSITTMTTTTNCPSLMPTVCPISKYLEDKVSLEHPPVAVDVDDATPSPKTTHQRKYTTSTRLPKSVLSNKGQTAQFMRYWPSITTFTLVSGWTPQDTKRLKAAVESVVMRNPVLTGRAETSGTLASSQVSVRLGAFPVDKHEFVVETKYDKEVPDLDSFKETQLLKFMDENLSQLVPKSEYVIESVKSGNPLFQVNLITMPGGFACYAMRLSHCVGDGVTYYNIMKEIDHYFNHPENGDGTDKEPPPRLEWIAPSIVEHSIWPSRFSVADVQKSYGFPFLLGLLRNVCHMDQQAKDYLVLSKKKIEQKKSEMVDKSQHTHLSSNDVITAALCDANKSSDIFCFAMNMRYLPGCRHYGFNFHNEIPFPTKAAANNPNAFRNIVKQGYHYETDKLPIIPYVVGRVGRLSSIASIQHLVTNKNTKVLCHGLLSSFVDNVPLDVAFITSMNDDNFLVVHNFREIDKNSKLLQEISLE